MAIQSDTSAKRQISHTGSTIGSNNVQASQNLTGREDTILEFTCPRKFKRMLFDGDEHTTKFVPRAKETATIADADGSAVLEEDERTVTLGDLIPVSGETALDDQPYPVVVAYNVTQGTEVTASDLSVDYVANTVTVAESAVAAGDDVSFWYVIAEGNIKVQGVDRFDNKVGSASTFGTPVHTFADLNQNKRGNRPNLDGAIQWTTDETVEIVMDSPEKIVWSDADYPRDETPSSFQTEVHASTV